MALTKVTSSVLDTLTGLTVTAADGVADNDFVASISNQEATDGRSFGLAINAGSTDSDFALNINTHDAGANLMRLKGSGDCHFPNASAFGIGTDSASRELDIQAASGWAELALRGASGSAGSLEYYNASTKLAEIYADTSTNIIFRNSTGGTTERMRIDASGNLLVGTTDAAQDTGAGVKIKFDNSNGRVFTISSNSSGECFSAYQLSAGYKFYVTNNGKIHTAVGPDVYSISDERLKENIKDLDKGLTDILKLKPRTFDWKENEGSGKKNVSGFIAQECEEAGFEEFVGDFKHNTLTDAKSFSHGGLIPALVKAIQEQQEEIKQLKQNSHAPKTIEEMEGYEDLINRIKELENK